MEKSIFETLSSINCNEHIEKKNGLTYLSWTWAWGFVKKNYPNTFYKVREWNEKPYLFDENLGYLVETAVTINNETITMRLPVMDGANKAQKSNQYVYKTKYGEKTVEAATMFDINTAIMRCLTKNIAMFGLGHYIYAGEDMPEEQKENEIKKQVSVPVVSTQPLKKENKVEIALPLVLTDEFLKLAIEKLSSKPIEIITKFKTFQSTPEQITAFKTAIYKYLENLDIAKPENLELQTKILTMVKLTPEQVSFLTASKQ